MNVSGDVAPAHDARCAACSGLLGAVRVACIGKGKAGDEEDDGDDGDDAAAGGDAERCAAEYGLCPVCYAAYGHQHAVVWRRRETPTDLRG